MTLGQLVGRALVAGLCIAAAAAIAAFLQGDFSDTHENIVLTSLGFSFFTALGASGDALRRRRRDWRVAVGALTTGLAALAFVLLVIALWVNRDGLWEAFGVAGLSAFCGSHASLVLRGHAPGDPPLISALVWTSIVTAVFDTGVGNAAILGFADDISEGFGRFLGVVLVVTVLSTALPPILRRLARTPAAPDAFGRRDAPSLADEIAAVARRLEQTPVDVRREAATLRELAERARS